MKYLLAIDQGTSSTRAMLYTINGVLVASRQYPITQYYPQNGWVEHDPEEIWQKTLTALKEVTSQVDAAHILGCGLTNQRETVVVWDKNTGKCLAPAIVWQDRRTLNACKALQSQATLIQQKTGLLPDPYFSATKLQWLLKNHPEVQTLAEQGSLAFGTIDSFLIWRLTENQEHLTDYTNASRTLLFNIHTGHWDEELLRLFKIPESILPKVYSCDRHFGTIDKKWLGHNIPLVGVAGDQHAALIGQGCYADGMIKATYGTGGFLLLNTGEKAVQSSHQLLTTIAYRIKEKTVYGLEGSIYHAGTTVRWLRDGLGVISASDETETLACSLESNQGVYLISSFTGLGAPHWLSHPGALLYGLSLNTTPAHLARAALEGVCYQTREILACMREDSDLKLSVLRVDGGMAANQWFLQFLADQCALQVQKPRDIETTAKGAAMLAALGIEAYSSLEQLQNVWEVEQTYHPVRDETEVAADYKGWQQALAKLKSS